MVISKSMCWLLADSKPLFLLEAYSVISCASETWLTFRNDVYGKLKDKFFSFKFFNTDITSFYQKFNQSSKRLSINRESLSAFTSKAFSDIDRLKKSFLEFNQSITDSDTHIKTVIDNLTRTAYEKSVKAMYNSVNQNKNCVPNIVSAMRDMFNGFLSALSECTDEKINISPIDVGLSNGFEVLTDVFKDLNHCASQIKSNNAEKCIKNVSIPTGNKKN